MTKSVAYPSIWNFRKDIKMSMYIQAKERSSFFTKKNYCKISNLLIITHLRKNKSQATSLRKTRQTSSQRGPNLPKEANRPKKAASPKAQTRKTGKIEQKIEQIMPQIALQASNGPDSDFGKKKSVSYG